jgi:hypothetical protein
MTRWGYVIAAICALALGGCPGKAPRQPAASATPKPEAAPRFTMLLSARQLGPAWATLGSAALGAWQAAPEATCAWLLTCGKEQDSAYWFNRAAGTAVGAPLDSGGGCFDWADGADYVWTPEGDDLISWRKLPDGLPQRALTWRELGQPEAGPPGRSILCASASASGRAWFAVACERGAQAGADAPAHILLVFALTQGKLLGRPAELELAQPSEVLLTTLGDGALVAADGCFRVIAKPGAQPGEPFPNAPGARPAVLTPDCQNPGVAWGYCEPVQHGAGTGRAAASAVPGQLMRIDIAAGKVESWPVGLLRFNEVRGDDAQGTQLLISHNCGVIERTAGGMRWLLRTEYGKPVFLAGRDELWAAVDGGIYGIPAAGLAQLAPQLSAAQAFPEREALPLHAACTALGWDWASVQVSPLADAAGRLLVFDAASLDSASAELDWDMAQSQTRRVWLVRGATPADAKLLALADAGLQVHCQGLLAALGWPGAQPDGAIKREAGEVYLKYMLDPPAAALGNAGEFTLWLTSESLSLTLDDPALDRPRDPNTPSPPSTHR